MGRSRKLLKPQLEGKHLVVRFLHPVLRRTVRVNLGRAGAIADDNLAALNKVFLNQEFWHALPEDLPDVVQKAWCGPAAGVILGERSVEVNGSEVPIDSAEIARVTADNQRLEGENRALRMEVRKLRRQLEDSLGRKLRSGPALTLQQSFDLYASTFKGRDPNYTKDVMIVLKCFLRRFGPTTPMDDLEGQEATVDAWIKGLTIKRGQRKGQPIGPSFQNRIRWFVLQFLEAQGVVLDRKAVSAPSRVALRSERGRIRWLQRKQAEALAEALPAYWSDLFRLQVATGLRANELITLKKGDFNEDCSVLTLSPLLHLGLKTGPRTLRVPRPVRRIVKRRLAEFDVVFPDTSTNLPWKDARDYNKKFRDALNHAAQTLDIPFKLDCRVGRRTCASLLIRSGMGVESIAAILGNSPMIIREHYGRILPIEVDPSAAALNSKPRQRARPQAAV